MHDSRWMVLSMADAGQCEHGSTAWMLARRLGVDGGFLVPLPVCRRSRCASPRCLILMTAPSWML
jgi:hypothetical protein